MTRPYSGNGLVWVDTVPIPANAEQISERNCAPAWEANADRTAYLKRVTPSIYKVDMVPAAPGHPGFHVFLYANSGALESINTTTTRIDIPNCSVGDKIAINSIGMWSRALNMSKALTVYVDAIDRVNETPGVQTHVPGAIWTSDVGLPAGMLSIPFSVSLSGLWTVALAGTTRLFFAVNGPTLSSSDTMKLFDANIVAVHYPVR